MAPRFLPLGWQIATFRDCFRRVERSLILDDSATYSCVGVRWYGLGAFVRERCLGMDIARKEQWVIRAGDVVYNKLFAWKGAFAVADSAVDGCIVSDKFPTYEADPAILDLDYVKYYFLTPDLAHAAGLLSKGAAAISKLTLNPPQFWDLTLPVPPLPEQHRIAKRLAAVTARVRDALALRQQASALARALLSAALNRLSNERSPLGALGAVLCSPPRNGWSARCDGAEGGTPVLSLGAVTGFDYNPSEYKLTSLAAASDGHFWLKPGDLLLTRSNTPELVGHAAIYDGRPAPCIYPDLMMRLELREDAVERQFVWYWLQTPLVREFIRDRAKGTSPTMKKISQSTVMAIPFPCSLNRSEQRRQVLLFDALHCKIADVRRCQSAIGSELEAVFPSVLDAAFNGEL